jgi:hypothetical protein
LTQVIADTISGNPLHDGCVKALAKTEKYYDKASAMLLIATVLNPGYNLAFFKNIWENEPTWIQNVIDAMEQAFDRYANARVVSVPGVNTPAPTDTVPSFRSIGRRTSAPIDADGDPREELTRYYAMAQVDPSVGSLGWWRIHTVEFPILSAMARDYLAIQGSSVPSEELFSGGVDLVTPDRNSLTHETISMSMSLKAWIGNEQIERTRLSMNAEGAV